MNHLKSPSFQISQQSRKLFLFGGGIILILLVFPSFIHGFSSNIPIHSILQHRNTVEETPNFSNYPKAADESGLIDSFLYGNLDITNTIPLILDDNQMVVVGSRGASDSNLFIVNYQNQLSHEYSTSTTDIVKTAMIFNEGSGNKIFIAGNRESTSRKLVFFTSIDSLEPYTINKLYPDVEIAIGDDCWLKQAVSLSNGNFLLVLQSLTGINSSFWLYEVSPFGGSIIYQKAFPFTSSYTISEMDIANFNYVHTFDDGRIFLVGRNSSTSDAGISMYLGTLGGNWLNKSISGDLELQMMDVASDGAIYTVQKRFNSISSEDELDIIHFSANLDILSNATLSSSSYSYKLMDFRINHEISGKKPFLLYSIWDESTYPGFGYAFVDGTNFLQKSEELPSNIEMTVVGEIKFLSNGDLCFGKNTISESVGEITVYRISETSSLSFKINGETFTQYALPIIIGENPSDGSILINTYDFGHSGVFILSSSLNAQDEEILLENDQICRANFLHTDKKDIILFYGYQGDYFNNQGKALLLAYSLSGNLLKSSIREENAYYSEYWDWISVLSDSIFLTGMQTNVGETGQNTLILGKINFEELTSPFQFVSNIQINSESDLQNYLDKGIITGNGDEFDPYVIENIKIDGNREGTDVNKPGIDLAIEYTYIEIRNCVIENIGTYQTPGILITYTNFVKIENSNFTNCYIGISLYDSNNASIYNNTIANSQSVGILINDDENGDGSNGNYIGYNTIKNTRNTGESWAGSGISILNGNQNEVENNVINFNDQWGVFLDYAWEDIDMARVMNTKVHDNDLSNNGAPYNPSLSETLGNRFWNNTGAEDFPSTDFNSFFDNIPGFPLEITIFTILSGVIYLNFKNREKVKIR